MKKIRAWLALTGMSFCIISGCIIVGVHDQFTSHSGKESAGMFVPDFYIQKQQSRFYLPLLRVDVDRLPHDLVLMLYDQTYTNTSRFFDKVVLESVTVEFPDRETVELVSTDTLAELRTYSVPKGKDVFRKDANLTFRGAVARSETFTLILKGTAIKPNGEEVPFRSAQRYEYNGRKWSCWTLMQEWASC